MLLGTHIAELSAQQSTLTEFHRYMKEENPDSYFMKIVMVNQQITSVFLLQRQHTEVWSNLN